MTEGGEVRFGDARIRYQVVRSPRRHKTIEITVDEPGLVAVAAPADTSTDDIVLERSQQICWRLATLTSYLGLSQHRTVGFAQVRPRGG